MSRGYFPFFFSRYAFQRASAAFRAPSVRSFALTCSHRALTPSLPPMRPCTAKKFRMGSIAFRSPSSWALVGGGGLRFVGPYCSTALPLTQEGACRIMRSA